ncbi:TetR/AcrR family transcriptional regulator [Sphingosinicella sp. LHD-64]|uniref:TetR/AcrR family transcriptional regulator n=1 Tax=Sphingosinicella sp. LHD-64 TaxID=3072139 RepID=UPI00280FE4D0|nr:TetR/AcrR family transcriptional regulator [Sphingosinicella sp. LHD-64]MDQ8757824.1 TetR/AcrR family transcriptional regulator [Sphingosinicella sp. LHD-64]
MATGKATLVPTQQRSRERFERILASAAELLVEKGSEEFRMSDVVARSGVPFGSLYQYFPDKTAIVGTLAARYDAIGRACVEGELAAVAAVSDVKPALGRIVDGYYRMFADAPVMRAIWQATQADRTLQARDAQEGAHLASLLGDTLARVAPEVDATLRGTFADIAMVLIAAAVRHALVLAPDEAERSLALFKAMLPEIPAGLPSAR